MLVKDGMDLLRLQIEKFGSFGKAVDIKEMEKIAKGVNRKIKEKESQSPANLRREIKRKDEEERDEIERKLRRYQFKMSFKRYGMMEIIREKLHSFAAWSVNNRKAKKLQESISRIYLSDLTPIKLKEKIEMFLIPSLNTKSQIASNDEIYLYFKEAPGKCIEILIDFICDPFFRPMCGPFLQLHEQLEVHEAHVMTYQNFEPRPFRDFYDYQLPRTEKMRRFVKKTVESNTDHPLNSFSLKESEFVIHVTN